MGIYLGPFRLTKRGVRVRIGPRIARLHVGAGRPGISTGAGPFTAYKPLGRASRSGGGGSRRSRGGSRALLLAGIVVVGVIGAMAAVFGASGGGSGKPAANSLAASAPAQAAAVPASPAVSSTAGVQQPATGTGGCHPLSNEGTCYEPGEFCRTSDHGVTGLAGDGVTIVCEDNDGWRWESVAGVQQPATGTGGCHPLSNEGTCYEPGEFCRTSDHGVTGLAGDGVTIVCQDNDGWRWEPVGSATHTTNPPPPPPTLKPNPSPSPDPTPAPTSVPSASSA